MMEGDTQTIRIKNYKGAGRVKSFENDWLKFVKFTQEELDGPEVLMRLTACRDADGTPYLRFDRIESEPEEKMRKIIKDNKGVLDALAHL